MGPARPLRRRREVNASDAEAFVGTTTTTTNWSAAWTTTRYLTYDMNSPLPAGVATSGVTFDFDFADNVNNAGNQTCFYFQVLRRSTGVVIGTHGSSAAPVACQATTAVQQTSTPLPEVTTRPTSRTICGSGSTASTRAARAMRVDRAIVSGSTTVAPFTLYETTYTDAADSTPATVPWQIATADAVARPDQRELADGVQRDPLPEGDVPRLSPGERDGHLGAARPHLPPDDRDARPRASTSTCCRARRSLATYGSATTPFCATGAAYTTNTIALPVLNTAARVNGAIVRMYVRTTNGGRTQHDHFRLDVGYAVD